MAELGIVKGQPFASDQRMQEILTEAARIGHAQLCVQSFADRRPERRVWEGTQWEWAVLRPENGTFDAASYMDLYAREKWFYQAQIESPAMFARAPGAGSLYWLGLRDHPGAYLDGTNTYTLTVPQLVPARLFWSVTVYDAQTRSEIATDQNNAALRSLFELANLIKDAPLELWFGPQAPRRRRRQGPLDQDHPRPRLVRVLPHLRPRGPGLRPGRLQTDLAPSGSWRTRASPSRCHSGVGRGAYAPVLHTGRPCSWRPRHSGGAPLSYRPTRSIEGTVAAITGASAGIGAATARALVGAGARVALGARRNDRLASLVGELGDEHAVALPGDVRDPQYNEALVAAAVEKWGRLDTVVANAGIGAYGGILDIDDAQLREMVETNYLATVWTMRSGVRQFRAQGDGGDIVIVSSVAGFRGGEDEAVYAGTKFAQVGLGGSLDRELRAEGMRVTLICPAGTATEFAIGAGRDEGSPELDAYLRPDDVAHAIRVVLEQPRSVRTTVWQLWSSEQQS